MVPPVKRTHALLGLAVLIPVVLFLGISRLQPKHESRVAARVCYDITKPPVLELPTYCVPYGKGASVYPKLRLLGDFKRAKPRFKGDSRHRFIRKASVPAMQRWTKAVGGMYVNYYHRKSRGSELIGFASVGGQVLPYLPLSSDMTDRVLMVIRQAPDPIEPNVWLVHPAATWVITHTLHQVGLNPTREVNKRVVDFLGIDLNKFDVVTLHLGVIEPERWCCRNGLYLAADSIEHFYLCNSYANQAAVEKEARGRVYVTGDGGNTISQSGLAAAPLGLFLYEWKEVK